MKSLIVVITQSAAVLLNMDLRELPGEVQTIKGILAQKNSCWTDKGFAAVFTFQLKCTNSIYLDLSTWTMLSTTKSLVIQLEVSTPPAPKNITRCYPKIVETNLHYINSCPNHLNIIFLSLLLLSRNQFSRVPLKLCVSCSPFQIMNLAYCNIIYHMLSFEYRRQSAEIYNLTL